MNLHKTKIDAKKQALNVLKQQRVTSVPVDIIGICTSYGVRVTAEELDDDTSGVIVIKNGRAAIGYNSKHPPNRQRFSVAHELGHFFLHSDEESVFVDSTLTFNRVQSSSEGVYIREIAANTFAAELLMPESILRDEIEVNGIDVHDDVAMKRLAVKYRVSEQALAFRLANLGLG